MAACIVTCGPASTRIDEVRRITNFSTGELGTLLTAALVRAGQRVICFRGEGATFPPPENAEVRSFFSNEELLELLREVARGEEVSQVFHAAALTDFSVAQATDGAGNALLQEKIPSAVPEIFLRLQPAAKVIAELRTLFPEAVLTGWKYELSGTPAAAVEKARAQLIGQRIDACVLNGRACGTAFAYLTREMKRDFSSKQDLVRFLAATTLPGGGASR